MSRKVVEGSARDGQQSPRETSPASMHWGVRAPIIAKDKFTKQHTSEPLEDNPKMKEIQKAVNHFLWGEYDKINEGDGMKSSLSGDLMDNFDDGFGFQDKENYNYEEEANDSQEDEVDKWLSTND